MKAARAELAMPRDAPSNPGQDPDSWVRREEG